MVDEGKEYELPVDNLEVLKKEVSTLSPEEENRYYKPLISNIKYVITSTFGDFIPNETLDKVASLEDRLLVTDKESFDQIYQQSTKDTPAENVQAYAFSDLGRGYMVFADNRDKWQEQLTEENMTLAAEAFGGEENAKAYFGFLMLNYPISHEILHFFHRKGLNDRFAEFGIRYYQAFICKELGLGDYQSAIPIDRVMNYVYTHLIKEYGDDVHKVFFGKPVSPETELSILYIVNEFAKKEGFG